jgi:hypothetical protein
MFWNVWVNPFYRAMDTLLNTKVEIMSKDVRELFDTICDTTYEGVFRKMPRRVFLDTSSLNFILEYGEYIHDAVSPPATLSRWVIDDIDAFYNIFLIGERASWQLAISPLTYKEVITNNESTKRHHLEKWFTDVWDYWLSILEGDNDLPSFAEAECTKIELLSSGILDILDDVEDRMLICDAIVYRCDCFCTTDWRTILKHRDHLKSLPIKIITPIEWWSFTRPYAPLWM